MAATLKGPGLVISQFAGDEAPFNSWPAICRWAAGLGYRGIQLPAGDDRFLEPGEGGRIEGLLRRSRRRRP